MPAPLIVGLGGTLRPGSSSESALRVALAAAEVAGARTQVFGAEALAVLPMYDPTRPASPVAHRLLSALREADGVIIASPGYHGSISGLVKNALDYVEELREDIRPYLSGRSVGCVTPAYGWQAAVTTLQALRTIVHALRGWPTPFGVAINATESPLDPERPPSGRVLVQLQTVAEEVGRLSRLVAVPAGTPAEH
jgi:FMN reductase